MARRGPRMHTRGTAMLDAYCVVPLMKTLFMQGIIRFMSAAFAPKSLIGHHKAHIHVCCVQPDAKHVLLAQLHGLLGRIAMCWIARAQGLKTECEAGLAGLEMQTF